MPTYRTPGVYFETVDTGRRGITAIRTDIAAFVGIAARGPLHQPTTINSWEQFQATFGGFIPQGYLAYTVKAFFENGGRTCVIVRVAAPPASTQADTAVAQPADGSASLVLSTDGFAPGAVVTVRQAPSLQKAYLLQAVDPASRKLTWQHPLGQEFVLNDPARPLHFETGAAAAAGVLLDGAGQPTLRIEASSPGAWGNALSVRVARSSSAATRTTRTPQPTDRASSAVESVVGFSTGALVRIIQEQTPAPPLETYRVVTHVAAGDGQLVWDAPLDAGYDLNQPADPPIFFETLTFALSVYEAGHLRRVYPDLSLVERHARYVERAITPESTDLIRVTDLGSPSAFPARLPDSQAVNLTASTLVLQAGRDGTAALQVRDFSGEPGSARKHGLRALANVEQAAIVAVPDVLIQPAPPVRTAPLPQPAPEPCLPDGEALPQAPTLPPQPTERAPSFSLDQVHAVQQALVAHCQTRRDRIALIDPPIFSRRSSVDVGEIQSWRRRFHSKCAGLYYPWLLVYDPLQLGGQTVRPIPPSGHVAGVYARVDLDVGVHRPPANVGLRWAQDVSSEVSPEVQGVLNPLGINCIRKFAGRGIRIYGARTVSSDPAWRYVNVRRLLMMIEEAIEIATQWAVFEPNDFYLRQTLALAITGFLKSLWERGALVGQTAEEAFFVTCDATLNPPAVVDLGHVIAEVGVAPVYPAEFVVFRIGRTEDELEIMEQLGR